MGIELYNVKWLNTEGLLVSASSTVINQLTSKVDTLTFTPRQTPPLNPPPKSQQASTAIIHVHPVAALTYTPNSHHVSSAPVSARLQDSRDGLVFIQYTPPISHRAITTVNFSQRILPKPIRARR